MSRFITRCSATCRAEAIHSNTGIATQTPSLLPARWNASMLPAALHAIQVVRGSEATQHMNVMPVLSADAYMLVLANACSMMAVIPTPLSASQSHAAGSRAAENDSALRCWSDSQSPHAILLVQGQRQCNTAIVCKCWGTRIHACLCTRMQLTTPFHLLHAHTARSHAAGSTVAENIRVDEHSPYACAGSRSNASLSAQHAAPSERMLLATCTHTSAASNRYSTARGALLCMSL
jgi:hypothetical protein